MQIKGTGFSDGATVTFGGLAATSVVVIDQYTITCLTPAHSVGLVDVVVTNPDGQAATLTDGFRYSTTFDKEGIHEESTPDPPAPDWDLVDAPNPTVLGIVASEGSKLGGTRVLVYGTDFDTGATVTIGGSAATAVVYVNSKAVVCTTPAHAVGAVDVVLTNGDGKSGTLTGGYTYINPLAVLTNVHPSTGSTAGGTSITLLGENFVDPVDVIIGGLTALSIVVVNSQKITCVTPQHTRGVADITVTNLT